MRIALVNMPVTVLEAPSIALTQLRGRLLDRLGDAVQVDIVYANQEFARYLGLLEYARLVELADQTTGAGDWIFRHAAFPAAADNTAGYLRRYFAGWSDDATKIRRTLMRARDSVDAYLDELVTRYALMDCGIVGFTSMFAQNLSSFALAHRIKQKAPSTITVIGGANCELPMGTRIARSVPAIDYVFTGPALISFPEFVAAHLAGDRGDVTIRGVLSSAGLERGNAPLLGADLDIDQDVDLDYGSFLDQLAALDPELRPVLYFETSRGCWWGQRAHCTFCGLNGLSMGYREMAPERALRMFERLFRYTDRCQDFSCVDNIMARSYFQNVLPALRPPAGTTIAYEVKANLTDNEVATLAAARVTRIQPGVEALATSTLKLMRKGSSAFQNLQLLKSCVRHGVQPFWNLLVGFPGEDESVYQKYLVDIPALVHLPPPSGVSIVRFDRYSPYHQRPDDYGLVLSPFRCYGFLYPWDEAAIEEIAYYFSDRGPREYRKKLSPWLAPLTDQVERWRSRWNDAEASVHLRVDWGSASARCIDTRFGESQEYLLSPVDADVLWCLREPRRTHNVCAVLRGRWSSEAVLTSLAGLGERRLVFTERDRYLSIAVDGETSGGRPEGRHHRNQRAATPPTRHALATGDHPYR